MNAPTFDRDTGLAAMIADAQPRDHGVLADWIEDHLGYDDLAAVLRAGLDDPHSPARGERMAFRDFLYRRLDRLVMLTMAAYCIREPVAAGLQPAALRSGFVVCLCTPPEAPGGLRRWGRWSPAPIDEPALPRLWRDLGEDLPKWGE